MKLATITENIKSSRQIIRQAGQTIGDLISYLKDQPESDEKTALYNFLSNPTPKKWEETKWILDSLLKQVSASNNMELKNRAKKWLELNKLMSPTITASLYDVDQRELRGTPAKNTGISKIVRDRAKSAMGPQGYIAALSNIGNIRKQDLRNVLKGISKDFRGTLRAIGKDMRSMVQNPPKRF